MSHLYLVRSNPLPSSEHPHELGKGDVVADSPVGPGVITGFSERGYPQVKHVTVAWLKRADGLVFDPNGVCAKRDPGRP